MNITESRLPQDGAIKTTLQDLNLDLRVSSIPTNEGEKIVIRILDYSRSLAGIDSLGFNEKNLVKLKKMIQEPNGIILITGATGSGKSTTVYSILQVLNKKETNIITVEDPIEMNLEGLNQVQVNSEIGLDFATVLRSILRQDPNIILIGEIRDSETAKIAVRASITGHLVLSTVHTNNSLSTIERLLDMNVERYLLSSALTGIISQRLAKMLCKHCRKKEATTPYQKKVFRLALHQDVEETYVPNHEGCEYCSGGYHDRVAIQEVLMINDEIRNALNEDEMKKENLQKIVYNSDVITMLQDGLYKVLDGTTSFEEIYRIIDIDDDLDTLMKIGVISDDDKTPSQDENTSEVTEEKTSKEDNKEEIANSTKEDSNVDTDNIEAPVIIDIEEENPEIIPVNDPDDEDIKNKATINLPNLTT